MDELTQPFQTKEEKFRAQFNKFISDDERILRIFKPNVKAVAVELVIMCLRMAIICAAICFILFYSVSAALTPVAITFCVFFAIMVAVSVIQRILFCKNTAYAITDKKVIIRNGIFHVTTNVISFSTIHSINSRRRLGDQFFKDVGQITFRSSSNSVISDNLQLDRSFGFGHIDNQSDIKKLLEDLVVDAKDHPEKYADENVVAFAEFDEMDEKTKIKGEKVFAKTLEEDEEILTIVQPDKLVGAFQPVTFAFSFSAFVLTVLFGVFMMMLNRVVGFMADTVACMFIFWAVGFVVCEIIYFVLLNVKWNNEFYAVTNKRLIFRKKFFQEDIEIMEFEDVEQAEIHVSLTDKIFRKNTGTIHIGSESNPILQNKFYTPFSMYFIKNPNKITTGIDVYRKRRNGEIATERKNEK